MIENNMRELALEMLNEVNKAPDYQSIINTVQRYVNIEYGGNKK